MSTCTHSELCYRKTLNLGLREFTTFIVSRSEHVLCLEKGITSFFKAAYCNHDPDKWPSLPGPLGPFIFGIPSMNVEAYLSFQKLVSELRLEPAL